MTIGIATFPSGADSAAALVDRADLRLYAGKQAGKDCVVDAHGDALARARRTKKNLSESASQAEAAVCASRVCTPKLDDPGVRRHPKAV